MDNRLDTLAVLIQEKRFDEALSLISSIEKSRNLTFSELLLKGRSIQLASGNGTPPLGEAERAFIQILEQDGDYVPALLELGWFYFAVENDAMRAMPLFERAISLSLEQLKEAIRGKKECLEELRQGEENDKFVQDIVGALYV
jgi:hypothetical protein